MEQKENKSSQIQKNPTTKKQIFTGLYCGLVIFLISYFAVSLYSNRPSRWELGRGVEDKTNGSKNNVAVSARGNDTSTADQEKLEVKQLIENFEISNRGKNSNFLLGLFTPPKTEEEQNDLALVMSSKSSLFGENSYKISSWKTNIETMSKNSNGAWVATVEEMRTTWHSDRKAYIEPFLISRVFVIVKIDQKWMIDKYVRLLGSINAEGQGKYDGLLY